MVGEEWGWGVLVIGEERGREVDNGGEWCVSPGPGPRNELIAGEREDGVWRALLPPPAPLLLLGCGLC